MPNDAKILIERPQGRPSSRFLTPDVGTAWRWIGWFALLLTAAGLADWLLAWTPLRFGSPEWEFGTIVSSFSGLPLLTMGFAGILGSAVARGVRWQILFTSIVVLLFALAIGGALVIFALDIPIAMQAVQGPAKLGIMKAIAKTLTIGVLFGIGYFIAAIGAMRHASRRTVA